MRPTLPGRAAALHDGLTRLGFVLSGVCLLVIVVSYCYEVVARYFLASPTTWASSLVSYMLCYMVFLAMPELSRQRVHIFISIFLDTLKIRDATLIQRGTYVVAAVACLLGAAFCMKATYAQFTTGIETVNEWRIQKWMLSIAIPYGLFSAGIHYIRHFARGEPYQTAEIVQS
ncbi:TRAP transporter small permease subunit [Propylenella binzhouense]|uniref:TRAP transporter small permease subunit n=1 Tax=Propylenella binzhouense TaxID=2555902 RepID=UPI00136897B6